MKKKHKTTPTKTILRHTSQIVVSGMKVDIPPELDLPAGAPFEGHPKPDSMRIPEDIQELFKPLIKVATHAWRLQKRMVDDEGEPLEETRRLFRFVEGIYQALNEAGISIIDKEGKPYDDGMREKPISFEPVPGLLRDEIHETIRPAIRFKEQLIFAGEIVVGTPVTKKEPDPSKEAALEEEKSKKTEQPEDASRGPKEKPSGDLEKEPQGESEPYGETPPETTE